MAQIQLDFEQGRRSQALERLRVAANMATTMLANNEPTLANRISEAAFRMVDRVRKGGDVYETR